MGFFRDENDGVSKFSKEIVSQLNIGKHTKKNYGKSPSLIGKSTMNGPFSIANC